MHDDEDKIYIINTMIEKYTHQIYIYNKADDDKLYTDNKHMHNNDDKINIHNEHDDEKYIFKINMMIKNIHT